MSRYQTPQALRRALEDRLLALVRREGGDINRLRRQTAFDRLLCRLFREANAPWLLKGGYAMELRIQAARTTRDIDLAIRQLPVASLHHRSGRLVFCRRRSPLSDALEIVVNDTKSSEPVPPCEVNTSAPLELDRRQLSSRAHAINQ
jgi:hypothetical protein